jgi:hypothetical protein
MSPFRSCYTAPQLWPPHLGSLLTRSPGYPANGAPRMPEVKVLAPRELKVRVKESLAAGMKSSFFHPITPKSVMVTQIKPSL